MRDLRCAMNCIAYIAYIAAFHRIRGVLVAACR
jgi:hypothetical protein